MPAKAQSRQAFNARTLVGTFPTIPTVPFALRYRRIPLIPPRLVPGPPAAHPDQPAFSPTAYILRP